MGFESLYAVFAQSILANNIVKMEKILSESDNRKPFIVKSVNQFGKSKLSVSIHKFMSLGLKKELLEYIENFSINDSILTEKVNKVNSKVVCIHENNKLKNERYHLSGSSFKNKKVEIPA